MEKEEMKEKRMKLSRMKDSLWKLRKKEPGGEERTKETDREEEIDEKLKKVREILEKEKMEKLEREKEAIEAEKVREKRRKLMSKSQENKVRKEEEKKMKIKKEKLLKEKWSMLRWITGFIAENNDTWEKEKKIRIEEEKKTLKQWEKLSRLEKVRILKEKEKKEREGEVEEEEKIEKWTVWRKREEQPNIENEENHELSKPDEQSELEELSESNESGELSEPSELSEPGLTKIKLKLKIQTPKLIPNPPPLPQRPPRKNILNIKDISNIRNIEDANNCQNSPKIPAHSPGERARIFLKAGRKGSETVPENDDKTDISEGKADLEEAERIEKQEEEPCVTANAEQKFGISSHQEEEGKGRAGRVTSKQSLERKVALSSQQEEEEGKERAGRVTSEQNMHEKLVHTTQELFEEPREEERYDTNDFIQNILEKAVEEAIEASKRKLSEGGDDISLGQTHVEQNQPQSEAKASSKASREISTMFEESNIKIKSGFDQLKSDRTSKKVKKPSKKPKKADKINDKNKITRYFNKNTENKDVKTLNTIELPERVTRTGWLVDEEETKAELSQARAGLKSSDCEPDVCGRNCITARVVPARGTLGACAESPHCGDTTNHHIHQISRDRLVTGHTGPYIGAKNLAPNFTGLSSPETEASGSVELQDQLGTKLTRP